MEGSSDEEIDEEIDEDFDEEFDDLLRKIAATPDVFEIEKPLRPGDVLAERFEIQNQLGIGGMGQVFAVIDRRDGRRVAAKVLGRLSPDSIAEIKREFRAAAEIVNPHLVRLHELCSDEGRWLFTMEIVDGSTLPALLGETPEPERNFDVLRSIFRQLALGLTALHRAGMIHRDLKPSNFLVSKLDHRVVLLDFGLARPLAEGGAAVPAGTPRYMAPEQARGGVLTEAVDWYAFGVVLYEALTQTLPVWIPPDPALLARAPQDLARICLDLLQIDPARRPTGDDVLLRLGAAADTHFSTTVGSGSAVLIGRERELADLEQAYQQTLAGETTVALIHGPSGIGKTALGNHFLPSVRARGALVLRGRCRERESMSYKAVDGIIDEIVELVDSLPEEEALALLPPNITDLTVLFPALRSATVVARLAKPRVTGADRGILRRHAIAAFSELLARLRARGPLVLWIDDLQWSDTESVLLLGPVLEGASAVPVLFIGSYRTGSGERVPLLEALARDSPRVRRGVTDLALGPLPLQQAEDLAKHWLQDAGVDAPAAARRVAHDAGGHPLFISELAQSARLGGPVPSTLSDLVVARVATLPPDARFLLELVAVAGVPLSRRVLRGAHDLDRGDADRFIDILRGSRLAWSQGLTDDDAVEIHHDRLREIILQELAEGRRRQCHSRLARALLVHSQVEPEILAGHYQAAGNLAAAGVHWIAAADRALAALAFDRAADLYHRGLAQVVLAPDERRAAQIRMAEALAYAGKGVAASEIYLKTAGDCPPEEEVELRRRAAEQLLLCGHVDRGLVVIEEVLRVVGMRETRGGRRALPWLVLGRWMVRASGMRYRARPERELSRAELARLDVSWTVACSLGAMDFLRGAEFQNRHLLLAIRAGEPHRLLRALTLEAAFVATPGPGSAKRSARLLEVADGLFQRSEDKTAASLLSLIRGIVAYLQGDLHDALKHCEGATVILRQRSVGAVWEMVTAHRFTIASMFLLGRLRDMKRFIPPVLSEAEMNGNLYATMIFRTGYSAAAWLARDAVDEARQQLTRARSEWKAEPFQLLHYNMLLGDVLLDIYVGDAERALAHMEEQWQPLRKAQLHRISVLRVQLWYLRAIAALKVAGGLARRGQHARARDLRRSSAQLARSLRRDPLQRSAGLADLIEGAVAQAEGDGQLAEQRIERSIGVFERHGMKLFAASARARLGQLRAGDAGAGLVAQAATAFAEEEVANPTRMIAALAPELELAGAAEARV